MWDIPEIETTHDENTQDRVNFLQDDNSSNFVLTANLRELPLITNHRNDVAPKVIPRGANRVDGLCSYRVGVQSCKKYANTYPTRDTNGLKKLNPNPPILTRVYTNPTHTNPFP